MKSNAGVRTNGDRAAKVDRTESAFQKERDRIRTANNEKTVRLRALRMAKEAGEREAAAVLALTEPAKRPSRKRKPDPVAAQS